MLRNGYDSHINDTYTPIKKHVLLILDNSSPSIVVLLKDCENFYLP